MRRSSGSSRQSPGTFRWSGTAILVFTPDPKVALPFSTRYTVTVDASATAVSGRKLAAPYTFGFTTPTVKLLATNWYRRNGRFDGPLVLGLRFNQPVRASRPTSAPDARLQAPRLDAASDVRRRREPACRPLTPAGLAAFEAKVAAAAAAAGATTPGRRVVDRDVGPAAPG